MSMQIIINLVVFLAWLAEARFLFRYMVRNETLKSYNLLCSHGYPSFHKGRSCHGYRPLKHEFIAVISMLLAFFGPIILLPMIIMYRPPVSKLEQKEYLDKLEAENNRLRLKQEKEHGNLLP